MLQNAEKKCSEQGHDYNGPLYSAQVSNEFLFSSWQPLGSVQHSLDKLGKLLQLSYLQTRPGRHTLKEFGSSIRRTATESV